MYRPLMDKNQPTLLDVLTQHLADLTSERATLIQRVKEIDDALSKAARQLGVDLSEVGAEAAPELPRLARGTKPAESTMGSVMVAVLLNADRGLTRADLRAELMKTPKLAERISHNMNSYYNTVARYLKREWILDLDGLLYHPSRAPLADGEDDPSGQHLAPNVRNLFGPEDRRAGNGDD